MRYSHRFFLYAPVALLGALAAAAVIYWTVTAHAFSKRLDALNGHAIASGVTLHFATKSIGGFPFRIDAVLTDMRIDVAGAHGPASWRTENFALHMLDYGGPAMVFETAGKQVLVWHDAKGAARSLAFVPGLLRASATLGGGGLERFDLELIGTALAPFRVARSELHLRRTPDGDALDLVFMADDVHLPAGQYSGLGDTISKLRLNARLAPGDDWNALLSGKGEWRKAADDWRAHSGTLDIAQLEIVWGKANARGAGLLTLDGARRPEGIVKLKIAGYRALAGAARRQAGMRENVLDSVITQAASAGKNSAGPLPVTLAFKDGLAYVNQAPAGFLSPLY